MSGEVELLTERMLDHVIGHDVNGLVGRQRTDLITPASLRAPNTVVYIGDSRNASRLLAANNKSATGWAIWMEAYLRAMGKPVTVLGSLAISGTRSDQHIATQLDAAIALNPAFIFWQGVVNDIAQQYPTTGTVVATMLANYKTMVKRVNAAGITFVHLWDRGAGNMTTAQAGQLNDLHRLIADYLMYGDADGIPNVIVIDNTAATTVVSNTAAIQIKPLFTQDQVHDNIPGAKASGYNAAVEFAPYLRKRPGHKLRNALQSKVGFGSRSMFTAAGFTGSVAVSGTGNSGNIPTNMTVSSCTGGVTAAYSVQTSAADADGNTWGEVKIVLTATAAGTCAIYNSLDRTGIVPGAIIRGGAEFDVVAGATGLACVYGDLEWFPATGGGSPLYDFLPPAATGWGNDTGGGATLLMEPDPLIIPAFTGTPFTNLAFRVQMNGAGTATILTRKWWAELATK
jgi:lysophospholipase L1-like esterase